MATTNHERVGRALDLLRDGLRPYVEREMRVEFGEGWQVEAASSRIRPNRDGKIVWDLANLLKLVWDRWNTVFGQKLAREHRTLVSELIGARNNHAHREVANLAGRDAYRVIDGAARLLRAISAQTEASAAEKLCDEMLLEMSRPASSSSREEDTSTAVDSPTIDVERRGTRSSGDVKGKYRALHDHLRRITTASITMTFSEVEKVLGDQLPRSAHKHSAWWANETDGRHLHARAWMQAGWKARPNLAAKCVTFVKAN
jgi:hypothetical protein